ncbi:MULTISPECIES: CBM35 domain-containing protein [unclassified Leifsonia]|uniref:CBM35 domain-containing protein n=1 Tax=unclassified Leifsonia TaxID=2663824 RepID=UPI0003705539|nr:MULTISPECIES: CBM35 domain-containing protein [unclassified Leifsonia]TDQ02465.1 carbohydrate-binding protein with CBM35 doain [Leifsonia sp. 115AMFTsu3.1]
MNGTHRRRRLRSILPPSIAITAGLALAVSGLSALPAGAAGVDHLGVDFSQTTGAFRGGATGTLYGLGDDGVPSQSVLNGAHITNTSQKPPFGAQHPNGDALQVESSFFAGGGQDLYVYAQDMYPDWPYNGGTRPGDANGDGVWDYLPILKKVVEDVATTSKHPEKYVFIPFNEPDGGNWYPNWSTQKDQFLADWSAAYQVIQGVYAEHGLGHARVGGPGDSVWHPDRSADFLAYAKARSELPDIFIWHELGTYNLATFRGHHDEYTALLQRLGIAPIPVNITEFGMLRDMGVPGQLIQWISMFESEKVDAQTAYWNYAGNLSDNSSRNNGANGGWWMFNWYGDLAGSTTAQVTPPKLNTPDSLQGLAAIDTGARTATVLFGGGSSDVAVDVKGLDASTFGSTVDVRVRADRLNGAEGASLQPPVILSTTAEVTDGRLSVTVPNSDRYSAYQLEITPRLTDPQPVSADLVNSTEAENATLANATVYTQDPSREWSFMASGGKDVGSFNRAGSSATWNVTVPTTGDYRLSVLSGTNASPGQHALFVDGAFGRLVKYSADLGWGYRGTADATIHLTAGTHALSLRASVDGTTLLPGADITLDRFDLHDVTAGERATYPAVDARLSGGATLSWKHPAARGYASVTGDGAATFYATTAETGYYDVTTHFASTGRGATPSLVVNGRTVALPASTGPGVFDATVRLFLPQGVNELTVRAEAGTVLVGDVSTIRGAAQKAADADAALVFRSEAEALPLSGTAVVQTDPAGSNGSADAQGVVRHVGYLGNGPANTLTVPRPSGFAAGDYQLVIGAANADKSAAINYNPQVISRFLDVAEAGGATTRAAFRHNYSWSSYWDKTVPLTLSTDGGALSLGNATAYGPNVDTVTLAKFVGAAPSIAKRQTGLGAK